MGQRPDQANESGLARRGQLAVVALIALLTVLLGAALHFFEPRASTRPVTIGVVQLTAVDAATLEGLREGLTDLGYAEGENLHLRHEGPANSIERLDAIVAGHLAAGVDLLFVSSTPAALAARRATAGKSVPVVFAPVNDPVRSEIVTTLQSPGGNITGVRLPQGDTLRLKWLLRVAPAVRRVLFVYTPQDASAQESLRQVQAASEALGVDLVPQPVEGPAAIDRLLGHLPDHIDALFLARDSQVESHIDDFVAAARARRLPLCAPGVTQVHAGALVSYGFVHHEIGRQAARLVDQILRGVPPADLPVETARNYLAIHLGTAGAIGLEPPDDVLRSAHHLVR